MRTRRPIILALAILLIAATRFCSTPCAQGQENREDWNRFLERESGWLGADGIYTVDVRFDAQSGRLDSNATKKTVWIFSDTIYGETKENGREYRYIHMANHSFAALIGDSPDEKNVEFVWRKPSQNGESAPLDAPPKNIVDGRYWLQDGVRYGDVFWCSAILVGNGWKPDRVDALEFPIDPQTTLPDFSRPQLRTDAPLFYRADDFQIALGAALCDDADDGFIYVFGYVDRLREHSRKDAVVARVPRDKFRDFDAWEFYVGAEKWSRELADLADPNAALARNVSTEFSVTRVAGGRFQDKWALVYTPGCISNRIAYRLAEKPFGAFQQERVFYRSNVPNEIPGVQCYNAKAHPALSDDAGLLVSYNVNRLGGIAKRPEEYRPRFVYLTWKDIEKFEDDAKNNDAKNNRQ